MSQVQPVSKMRLTMERGADFWNDSCSLTELGEAVEKGAVGATSNPVIVCTVVKSAPGTWLPVIDELVASLPDASEEDVTWRLIETIARRAAALLEPVDRASGGRKGFLSVQVNPKLYRSTALMLEHARRLASLAPNIAIKVPATREGIAAGVELVASGINVNATVSFTLAQALYVGQAFEGALDRAQAAGLDMQRLHPYVTLLVGRLDDLLQRVLAKESVTIDPGYLHWAGVAVFKKAYALFKERGYRSTLLSAAYRHHMHWSQLIGPNVVLSMPYAWWKQFEASDIQVEETIGHPVEPRIVSALHDKFADFRAAYDENGLAPEQFVRYGATVHTLSQFISGYQDLLAIVRERMLR
jgi:transaldolase